MKIVGLQALDFMGIRHIKTLLKVAGVTQFTGKNGAGKSTLLKFVEWMLSGPTSIDIKLKKSVVRRGAQKAWGQLELKDKKLGHYLITRSWTSGGTQDLQIIDQKTGDFVRNQQRWLKDMFTGLSFDPLAFAQMDTEAQVTELKRLSHVELDFAALAKADAENTEERRTLKKEVDQLRAQANAIDVVLDVPEKKIDEAAIFERINEVNEINKQAQQISLAKAEKRARLTQAQHLHENAVQKASDLKEKIEQLRRELELAENSIVATFAQAEEAEAEYEAAPTGEPVDPTALTEELKKAQRTNRAIDTRVRWQKLSDEIDDKSRAIQDLSDRLEARDRLRAEAVANAKLPVKGLTFDESTVLYHNLPLANLGEGEQIRISTLLGIAMNPGLRAMCIQHGEALDEDGLKVIEDLALEHDFQILMARVETSGKVGIVIQDGVIAVNNESQEVAG